ncbi:MAG: low-complexity tail membrane protein [Synechococcaceae cyanobacterium SM2_3_1]|nr:low-complexity tail membrane protein [Synechococcaceae cyanobacterium SM2_3_1]
MNRLWYEPFLWIHASGIALVPLWLALLLIGFSTGESLFFPWLEWGLISALGIAPVVWMQWQRPFYIFSLLAVAIPPDQIRPDQQSLLRGFQERGHRFLVVLPTTLIILFIGYWCYQIAPLFASLNPLPPALQFRFVGVLIAVLAFLGAHLFLQVPAAVFRLLVLVKDQHLENWQPLEPVEIRTQFTVVGRPFPTLLKWFPLLEVPDPREETPTPKDLTETDATISTAPVSTEAEPSAESAETTPPEAEVELTSPADTLISPLEEGTSVDPDEAQGAP